VLNTVVCPVSYCSRGVTVLFTHRLSHYYILIIIVSLWYILANLSAFVFGLNVLVNIGGDNVSANASFSTKVQLSVSQLVNQSINHVFIYLFIYLFIQFICLYTDKPFPKFRRSPPCVLAGRKVSAPFRRISAK